MQRAVLCALLAPALVSARALGDAIMCKAQERLTALEAASAGLSEFREKSGVRIYFMGHQNCGGQETPITFGNWSMQGVKPIHVFTAIADVERQLDWVGNLNAVRIIHEEEVVERAGSRGVLLQYDTGLVMADRQVYEWETAHKNADGSEYWFVATSEHGSLLSSMDGEQSTGGFFSPVPCDSCLSAHRIRAVEGGVYGIFSTVVNGHAPFGITPDIVSQMTWDRTANFLVRMEQRARDLAQLEESQMWQFPAGAMAALEDSNSSPSECQAKWDTEFAKIDALRFDAASDALVGMYAMGVGESATARPAPLALVFAGGAALFVASLLVVRACERRAVRARFQGLRVDEDTVSDRARGLVFLGELAEA